MKKISLLPRIIYFSVIMNSVYVLPEKQKQPGIGTQVYTYIKDHTHHFLVAALMVGVYVWADQHIKNRRLQLNNSVKDTIFE